MCGRFALHTPPERLATLLGAAVAASTVDGWRPHWNIAPTQQILGAYEVVVQGHDGKASTTVRTLQPWRWGLLAPWVTDPAKAKATFNPRAETLAAKPTFREAFRQRRLAIPASEVYEWARVGGQKQPYAFVRRDGEPLVLAGLWQPWRSPDGDIIQTATIITTAAGPDFEGIHDRQPVVLERGAWEHWLDPEVDDVGELEPLLRRPGPGILRRYRVGSAVGNPRNDGPELVEPLAEARVE